MLSKQYRLTKEYDFRKVKRYGERVVGPYCVLSWTSNKLNISRFGFIASKKTIAKAVKRHRAVRLLRESIQLSLSKIKAGFDVVIVVRSGIIGRGFAEVDEEMKRLLGKAELLQK